MAASPKFIPRFRAEHVGSLLRPRQLTHAFRDFHAGKLTAEAYRGVQDEAIRDAVRLQELVGLAVVTDGEFRRGSYWGHFVDALDGMATKPALFDFHDEKGEVQSFIAPHVVGKLRRRPDGISTAEFAFLNGVTHATGKITLPSPPTMHFWRGAAGIAPGVYADAEALFADLAAIYQAELADLARLGCSYVQIDEVPLAMLCDPQVRDIVARRGDDPAALVDLYIKAINDAVAARPAGMTVGLHMCRGNFKGKWLAEGGYDDIAERAFAELAVDLLFLEYDSPRAGDFAPLRFVPESKAVVLGLVCSKTPVLENVGALRRRIDEASRYVPLERLAISPQCGFASAVSGNPLGEADEISKLSLVVEVARSVWG